MNGPRSRQSFPLKHFPTRREESIKRRFVLELGRWDAHGVDVPVQKWSLDGRMTERFGFEYCQY
jgi:hypothetical protein